MKLGNPNGAAALRRAGRGGEALRDTVRANADEFAQSLEPVVEALHAAGHTSLRALASELNDRGIRTRRKRRWNVSNVRNLLARVERCRDG